jgi:hypothetical protein
VHGVSCRAGSSRYCGICPYPHPSQHAIKCHTNQLSVPRSGALRLQLAYLARVWMCDSRTRVHRVPARPSGTAVHIADYLAAFFTTARNASAIMAGSCGVRGACNWIRAVAPFLTVVLSLTLWRSAIAQINVPPTDVSRIPTTPMRGVPSDPYPSGVSLCVRTTRRPSCDSTALARCPFLAAITNGPSDKSDAGATQHDCQQLTPNCARRVGHAVGRHSQCARVVRSMERVSLWCGSLGVDSRSWAVAKL